MKLVNLIKNYNFDIKYIFIWHHTNFLMRWRVLAIIIMLQFHIISSCILMTLNIKTQNYEIVDIA